MTTKTALTTLDTDALAAELARRQEEKARAEAERAARLDDARRKWAETTWAGRDATEEQLREQGNQHRDAFSAAVRAADLPAAFAAWVAERAARYAREAVRNKAVSAGNTLGHTTNNIAEVRWYDPDFLRRLEHEADQAARVKGYDLADSLVPDAPTEA
ncbi:hypothetical protein N866_14275 [Actinotalea ferrariae CF5-4]|uniref:Uncharacterized protein n=1 Tax=Actinotalea ferrariae CF5-4 TaxID=948458 RepID=A0A021VPF9_9CELL|nr:hypothetical protein [Actinotalea ferrariae]EYR61920.1 hypothetical protein N866_14275 [Actinotalea ferrariae CF5-4]